MANPIQNGTAAVEGIGNNGTVVSMTGFATFLLQNLDLTHKFDRGEIKDNTGEDAQLSARNAYVEMTVDFIPTGASRAAAVSVVAFPNPLASVTLANFEVGEVNGIWIYTGDAKLSLKNGEKATYSLPLRQYTNATQNTALATAAS